MAAALLGQSLQGLCCEHAEQRLQAFNGFRRQLPVAGPLKGSALRTNSRKNLQICAVAEVERVQSPAKKVLLPDGFGLPYCLNVVDLHRQDA
jgi:hypothetical protein